MSFDVIVKKGKNMPKGSRITKVIIGKTSMDGHWRGVQAVAAALRDAGMEVIYVGSLTAEAVVKAAIQEDADVIGFNVGGSYEQIEELIKLLRENNMPDVLVIVGGVIPGVDVPRLKEMGVHGVFPPGSRLDDIVKFVEENVRSVD